MHRAFQSVLLTAIVVSGCAGSRLSHDEIRKQIAELGGSTLIPKSVSVRRVVSQSGNRAIAETTVELAVQLERTTTGSPWYISAVRLGDQDWVSVPELVVAVNETRRRETIAAMQKLMEGIVNYRKKNGSLPAASDIVGLTDLLHPQYMSDLVRVDSWNRPLLYESSGGSYRLRSLGPDGVSGTPDDILLPG